MSVHAGRAKMSRSYKDLMARWDAVTQQWDDPMSRDFHKKHLEPIEPKVRMALGAMEQMTEILQRIRRDCSL